MADINSRQADDSPEGDKAGGSDSMNAHTDPLAVHEPLETADIPEMKLIELLFFAYRDFVHEPDAILKRDKFGRSHHRILHFVNRHPGLSVAELLDVLKITKQSLAPSLRQLIDQGYITQEVGLSDRRQRLLFSTQ